jgi:hypothetical protein
MTAESKQRWVEHKADQTMKEFDAAILSLLPAEVQAAIKGLAAYVFKRGYDCGFDDGRTSLIGSRSPSYSIPDPVVVEIVAEPRDVA